MGERSRIQVPFGGGLERDVGQAVADSVRPRDVRDFILGRGRAIARKGSSLAHAIGASGYPGGHAIRIENAAILIDYQVTTGELEIYRLTPDGSTRTWVDGTPDSLDPDSDEPRLILTEANEKIFVAHEEPVVSKRMPTWFYDPFAATTVNTLQADLDGGGAADVKFRGVVEHLGYLFGWGYGTATDEEDPSLVRSSLSLDPTTFKRNHYVPLGHSGDPVLGCYSVGEQARGALVCFKGLETWAVDGYSPRTFSRRKLDAKHGLLSPRLALVYRDAVYFWSQDGPRVITRGGPSEDLALPLDLDGPDPDSIVDEGDHKYAFAYYDRGNREIVFQFGRRSYRLSVYDPRAPQWTYGEIGDSGSGGFIPACAFETFEGVDSTGDPPTGYPDFDTASSITSSGADVEWTEVGMDGDELVEIWIKPSGGSWTIDHTVAAEGDGAQKETLQTTLEEGLEHEVALRARRGGQYASDYTGADPDSWSALTGDPSRAGSFTTLLDAPTISSSGWQRTASDSEQIDIEVTPAHADRDIKIYRDDGAGGAYTELTTITAATHGGSAHTHNDTTISGERDYRYKATQVRGSEESADSSVETRWAGPDAPSGLSVTPIGFAYDASWTNGDSSASTEVESKNLDLSESFHLDHTEAPGGTSENSISPPGWGATEEFDVRIRHKLTSFTVDDYSKYHNPGPTYTTESSA